MRATSERKDYRVELHKINCPALIIHRVLDKLIPLELAKAVNENIKGSQFKLIQNAGHTLNLEEAKETAEIIINFLN